MVKSNTKLEWKGEKIKQSVKVEDVDMSLKDLINAIDHADSEISKMIEQKDKMKLNITQMEQNISDAKAFKFDRTKFEDKAIEILSEKLQKYYNEGKEEYIEKALNETAAIVEKDPSAYTDQQITNQKYVLFQRKLATDKKVAENIPNRLIRELIFDKPFYDNPFK